MDSALTYVWSVGGTDSGDFVITAAGALSFVNIPDFERPADSGRNNVYHITVNARDSDGATGSIALTVTVDRVNEPPTITGDAAPSIEEGGPLLVETYGATDQENATIVWQLTGNDSDWFEFTSSNGRLAFKAAPDFEDATDAGRNNVYDVTLRASAGGQFTLLNVAVTVTNKEGTRLARPLLASAAGRDGLHGDPQRPRRRVDVELDDLDVGTLPQPRRPLERRHRRQRHP